MKQLVLALAVSSLVSGCATSQQQIDSHAPALNSWVGAPIEEFLDIQGDPTTVVEEDDYQVYRFDASRTRNVTLTSEHCQPTNFNEPINENGQPGGCTTGESPWYTVTYACTYGLVVIEDVIEDWSMDGNNCKMMTVSHRPDQVAASGGEGQ